MSVIPPPPPARRGDSSCLKWGIGGCVVLGILFAIGIGSLFYFIGKSGIVKQVLTAAVQEEQATRQLTAVGKAIDQYVADKKHYPDRLKDLVPKYLPSEASLRIAPQSGSPPIWYKKPSKDAPPEEIILQTTIAAPVPLKEAPPWTIKLRKDGALDGTEYVYTDRYGRTQRIDLSGSRYGGQ